MNLLVALTWPHHVSYDSAQRWFASIRTQGWATTPLTEAGLARLAMNPRVAVRTPSWTTVVDLVRRTRDVDRHERWEDVDPTDDPIVERARIVGHRQVTDVLLAAAAARRSGRLATLDTGVIEALHPQDRHVVEVVPTHSRSEARPPPQTADPSELPRGAQRVVGAAAARGLSLEVRRFPEGTRTAADAAAAIGCDLGAIVKSLVLESDGGPLLVLTSGRNRVDYGKVATATGRADVRRADADTVRAATSFPVGGTAPFGHPAPLPTLVDRDLLAYDEVWAAGGTPDTVFSITPSALVDATGATPADIAE